MPTWRQIEGRPVYFLYFALTLWLGFLFFACGLDAIEWKVRGGERMEWYKNCGYRRGLVGEKDEPEPHHLPDNHRKAIRALRWWFEGYRQGVLDRGVIGASRPPRKDGSRWRTQGNLTDEEYRYLEEVNARGFRLCPVPREEWERVKERYLLQPLSTIQTAERRSAA